MLDSHELIEIECLPEVIVAEAAIPNKYSVVQSFIRHTRVRFLLSTSTATTEESFQSRHLYHYGDNRLIGGNLFLRNKRTRRVPRSAKGCRAMRTSPRNSDNSDNQRANDDKRVRRESERSGEVHYWRKWCGYSTFHRLFCGSIRSSALFLQCFRCYKAHLSK